MTSRNCMAYDPVAFLLQEDCSFICRNSFGRHSDEVSRTSVRPNKLFCRRFIATPTTCLLFPLSTSSNLPSSRSPPTSGGDDGEARRRKRRRSCGPAIKIGGRCKFQTSTPKPIVGVAFEHTRQYPQSSPCNTQALRPPLPRCEAR